jgi:hypothetical protein
LHVEGRKLGNEGEGGEREWSKRVRVWRERRRYGQYGERRRKESETEERRGKGEFASRGLSCLDGVVVICPSGIFGRFGSVLDLRDEVA